MGEFELDAVLDASQVAATPYGDNPGTDVEAQLQNHEDRLAGTLFESPDYLADYALYYDDFLVSTVPGGVSLQDDTNFGALNWTHDAGATSGSVFMLNFIIPLGDPPGTRGHVALGTGSDTDGYCAIQTQIAMEGAPEFIMEWAVVFTQTLSDGTNTYRVRVGLGDETDATDFSNGFYFEADPNSDTEWQCKTADGGSRTTTDSGVTIAQDTVYRLRIVCDGAGTVTFYINGTLVATHTTDLPDTDDFYGPICNVHKLAGTTSKLVIADYFYMKQART